MKQREIEFRAWDAITNKMVFSELVRNNYLAINLSGNVLGYEDTCKDQEVLFYPERFVITQFTGLLDKHGNKIFEGDILKWNPVIWGCEFNELVEWYFCF